LLYYENLDRESNRVRENGGRIGENHE
jgi:hypothetical protein